MRTDNGHRTAELYADAVRAFLHERLGGRVYNVERVGHGQWSQAFTFGHGGSDLVARFSALEEDFLKDQRVMAYGSAELPVPRVLDVGEVFGGFFAISERIPGGFVEHLDAAGLRRTLPALLRALDAMRAVDLVATSGFGVWGGDGHARHATWRAALLDIAHDRPSNRTHGWRPRLASAPFAEDAFETAFAELARGLDVCPEQRHLVHSDLLNFNVLVADNRVTGVIDWGSALYGDFLWDIAWLTFWQPWFPAWREVDIAGVVREHYARTDVDVPHMAQRVRCYELAIGLDGMAYQAFTQRWSDLEATARRTLDIARR